MSSPSATSPASASSAQVGGLRSVAANGVDFALLEAGPADGPLALCLHGFPDTAHTYRHLLPALAGAGYHAVAPFSRGYAPTSLATDGAYQLGALVADAGALHDLLGGDGDAVLVGHDWGAMTAYAAAAHRPDAWRRVVAMAVPPAQASAQTLFTYEQLRRSFYIFLFQTPLADLVLQMPDVAFLERLWGDWSPGYDATEDVAHVQASLADPAHLMAAVGYYRAMFDATLHLDTYAEAQAAAATPPPQPLLYLHGEDDGCFGLDPATDVLGQLAPGSRYERIAGAGHFLHLEHPGRVGDMILEFLRA
ncbi:MAG TPA: alpha/beta hydrolase [Acidimicrobiales bacterium]|nr:alpha/beta hydrolase [Acidimicrobiales bacterium]